MRIYLDDDSSEAALVARLRKDGHGATVPADVGMSGKSDAQHMVYALANQLVVLTHNYRDFLDFHDVIVAAHGMHAGILVVRNDNDRRRDMKAARIAAAIQKLERSGTIVANQAIVLNHWR